MLPKQADWREREKGDAPFLSEILHCVNAMRTAVVPNESGEAALSFEVWTELQFDPHADANRVHPRFLL